MKERYRSRIQTRAWVLFSNGDVFGEGRVLDLTAPGCQIESSQKVIPGQYLELRILLPGQTSFFIVELAAVRWARGSRFGAEFIRMVESEQQALNGFMAGNVLEVDS
jgi:hypothetical protein